MWWWEGGKWIGAGFQGQETHSVVGPFMGGVLQIRYAYILQDFSLQPNISCLLSDVCVCVCVCVCWCSCVGCMCWGEVRQG